MSCGGRLRPPRANQPKDKENRTVNINIDMIFRLAWLAAVAALVANLAWHELGGRK